jgi:hypothetical protein
MRSRARFLPAFFSFFLIVISLSPANALEQEDEQWLTPNRYEPGFQGIVISDIVNSFQMYSRLEARSNIPARNSAYLCASSISPNCDTAQEFN